MTDIIRENWSVLMAYTGSRFLFALYIPAFVFLLLKEKERWKRWLFVYAPGILLPVFLLSPLRLIYRKLLFETDTYYRLLWLVPFAVTIAYAAVTAAERLRLAVVAGTAALIVLGGSLVYRDAIITPAENRFHLSQVMVDVVNVILNHGDREADAAVGVCLPPEFVQQARQYDSRLYLPFSRSEVHWGYWGNGAYDAYIADPVNMEQLDTELRAGGIPYLVLADSRARSASPKDFGWEEIAALHGYRVYTRVSGHN